MRISRACLLLFSAVIAARPLPPGVRFLPGPVNGLAIGRSVLVYGDPTGREQGVQHVLFTHARRDVVWAGVAAVQAGAGAIVPAREQHAFTEPQRFWEQFEQARFHDYAEPGTKLPIAPLPVARAVQGGQRLVLNGQAITVFDTPGYTAGAVSYVFTSGGVKIACTGDLIYGDGQLWDVYSLQDAVPATRTRGYHGYAARAGDLIASLRRIAALHPDVLVPARGPLIENPEAAIYKLIVRLQALLASHFSTDALRWYWGETNWHTRSQAAGEVRDVLPMAEQASLPDWVVPIENTRVILSRTGRAFVVDAGYRKLLPALRALQEDGRFYAIDGIWITHYHDDHTDVVNDIARAYSAPVYFTEGMKDVLEQPGAYRLPCLTTSPIRGYPGRRDGETLRWQEFTLTFLHFPGQTQYHGGLLVKKDNGPALFFTGDSFTPSGMDDYCPQNRNWLRAGAGYDLCLRTIKESGPETWLLNQHVAPMFRYTSAQLARMQSELARRTRLLQELSPWPDVNYALDESWARVYPYGSQAAPGDLITLQLRVTNHAPTAQTYAVKWTVPPGWTIVKAAPAVRIAAHQDGQANVQMRAGPAGLHLITADVTFAGRTLKQWTEAMVRVADTR